MKRNIGLLLIMVTFIIGCTNEPRKIRNETLSSAAAKSESSDYNKREVNDLKYSQ